MSEEIKHNFQQAESIKPITESEKEYTEEEIDEIELVNILQNKDVRK